MIIAWLCAWTFDLLFSYNLGSLMTNTFELNARRTEGLNKWSAAIKKNLSFSKANVSVPEGKDADLFEGNIHIDEMNGGVLKTLINSSAQRVNLAHEDFFNHKKNKIFIINSCNGLLFRNNDNRKIVSIGDGIIIPSWNEFTEESFFNRNSVSIIVDISLISDATYSNLDKILWKKISELNYGTEMNKLMVNFLSCFDDRFCEKNIKAVLSLLALELDNEKKISKLSAPKNKLPIIIDYIKNKIKDPNLDLKSVAEYIGVSERMIQYILSESGVRFNELLAQERCALLAKKIEDNLYGNVNADIFDSGFNSISTACRQFHKIYRLTPKQYQIRCKAALSK